MRRNKTDYIVIAFGCILAFIILVISFIITTQKTPTETRTPTPSPQPTSAVDTLIVKPNVYDQSAQHTLIQKIENRAQLSQADVIAKSNIVATIPVSEGYGIIYESPQIRIDYTKASDLFQAEILTTNINDAKEEAASWFHNQGMSQQGLCDLPVDFYINWDVREELGNKILSFSPMANGCR